MFSPHYSFSHSFYYIREKKVVHPTGNYYQETLGLLESFQGCTFFKNRHGKAISLNFLKYQAVSTSILHLGKKYSVKRKTQKLNNF